VWDLGAPFTGRDAAARTFYDVLSLDVARHPDTWPEITALPVPDFQMERVAAGEACSALARHLCHGLLHHAQQTGMAVAEAPADPDSEVSPALALDLVSRIAARLFSRLS
jgi:hypothetical protein